MSACCECCVSSGRGLCDGLITRPEESYRLWCVIECDLETSRMRRPWPTGGCCAKRIEIWLFHNRFAWNGADKMRVCIKFISAYLHIHCGPGSSVGIANYYGLDGPGSNSGGDEIFRSSRPALGPTQPPVQWAPCFPGGKVRPGRAADHSHLLVPRSWKSRAIPLPTLWATPGL